MKKIKQRIRTPDPPPKKRRPRTPQMPDKKLHRLLDPLEEAAEERDELKQAWMEASQRANELALEASAANVPTGMITKAAHFTSQYLYQLEAKAATMNGSAGKMEKTKSAKRDKVPKKTNIEDRSSLRKSTRTVKKTGNNKRTKRPKFNL
jgi:hypothetical protein